MIGKNSRNAKKSGAWDEFLGGSGKINFDLFCQIRSSVHKRLMVCLLPVQVD